MPLLSWVSVKTQLCAQQACGGRDKSWQKIRWQDETVREALVGEDLLLQGKELPKASLSRVLHSLTHRAQEGHGTRPDHRM